MLIFFAYTIACTIFNISHVYTFLHVGDAAGLSFGSKDWADLEARLPPGSLSEESGWQNPVFVANGDYYKKSKNIGINVSTFLTPVHVFMGPCAYMVV